MARPRLLGKGSPGSNTLWPEDGPSAAPGTTEPWANDSIEEDQGTGPEPRVDTDLSSAADIVPKRVKWLWRGRAPLGKLTVIDGRPGLGKSCMTLDLAARVTHGREMPDGFDPAMGPRNVLIVTAEDDWEDTVVPRGRVPDLLEKR